jgi:hypothetical protein
LLLEKEDAREESIAKLEKMAMKGSWSKTQKEKVKKLINIKIIIILASLNTLLGVVFSSTSLGFHGQIPIIINHAFIIFLQNLFQCFVYPINKHHLLNAYNHGF